MIVSKTSSLPTSYTAIQDCWIIATNGDGSTRVRLNGNENIHQIARATSVYIPLKTGDVANIGTDAKIMVVYSIKR